jgi:aspartate beta-hydroxylase
LATFAAIAERKQHNVRALLGKARALELLAEKQRINTYLEQAISAYKELLVLGPKISDAILREAAESCISKMRFRGIAYSHSQLIVLYCVMHT